MVTRALFMSCVPSCRWACLLPLVSWEVVGQIVPIQPEFLQDQRNQTTSHTCSLKKGHGVGGRWAMLQAGRTRTQRPPPAPLQAQCRWGCRPWLISLCGRSERAAPVQNCARRGRSSVSAAAVVTVAVTLLFMVPSDLFSPSKKGGMGNEPWYLGHGRGSRKCLPVLTEVLSFKLSQQLWLQEAGTAVREALGACLRR